MRITIKKTIQKSLRKYGMKLHHATCQLKHQRSFGNVILTHACIENYSTNRSKRNAQQIGDRYEKVINIGLAYAEKYAIDIEMCISADDSKRMKSSN